jgi:hypothetical protein
VPNYLIECYLPRPRAGAARDAARRTRRAAEQISPEGVEVRYLRMTFLPEDETCFHLLEAESSDAVEEVGRRAGLGRFRVLRPSSNTGARRRRQRAATEGGS